MKIIANNLKDTEKLGKIIAKCIEKGTVICLDGELGVGKTSLTQFIAKEFDVYRIGSEDDMYDLGYDEYIYSEGVTVIEWANLIEGILPEERIHIEIKRIDDTKREISIEGKGLSFEKLVSELNL